MVTYNFGQVIDSYVAAVFPESDDHYNLLKDSNEDVATEEKPEVPRWHTILQCLQATLLIATLIALGTYALHVRSSYFSTLIQRAGLKEPVSLTDEGYVKFLTKLDEVKSSANVDAGTIQLFDLELQHGSDTFGYSDITTRRDVAYWLQFGLIPTLYRGLKSYNTLIGSTVRLSFIYNGDTGKTGELNPDENIVSRTALMSTFPLGGDDDLNEKVEDGISGIDKNEDEDVELVVNDSSGDPKERLPDVNTKSPYISKIPFASDGTHHTDSSTGGRFMYVSGDSFEDFMNTLNFGEQYSSRSPYFPLCSILSDLNTTAVTLEAFTGNATDYTMTHIRVHFEFILGANGDTSIKKVSKASSISTPRDNLTRRIQLGIYILVVLITVFYFYHSYCIHRGYKVYRWKGMYVLDGLAKLCLLICLIAYTFRLYMGHSSGPYIQSVSDSNGDYNLIATLGRNGRILDADLLEVMFNNLRSTIKKGYVSTGLFQMMTFWTITLLFILCCASLIGGGRAGKVLIFWAHHSMSQFLIACFAVLFTLFMMSAVNAYLVNSVEKNNASFRYNFATLFNILAGVSNDRVDEYVQNTGFMHTVSILVLIGVFTYFGIIVLATLMLTANPEHRIRSFEFIPLRNPFDSSRWHRIKMLIERKFGFLSMNNRRMILRELVFSRRRRAASDGANTSSGQSGSKGVATGSPAGGVDTAAASMEAETVNLEPPVINGNNQREQHCVDVSGDGDNKGSPKIPFGLDGLNIRWSFNYRFRNDVRTYRNILYWLILVGILVFGFKDWRYHNSRKLLQQTLKDRIKTDISDLPPLFASLNHTAGDKALKPVPDVKLEKPNGLTPEVEQATVISPSMGQDIPRVSNSDTNTLSIQTANQLDAEPGEHSRSNVDAPESSGGSDGPRVNQAMQPSYGVKAIVPKLHFSPRRIISRQEVFRWMTDGGLASMFQWVQFDNDMFHSATENPEFMSVNKRFFAVPANNPIFIEFKLHSADGFKSPIFSNMTHDLGKLTVRGVIHSEPISLGLREVFGKGATDFPDCVRKVYIHLLLVDRNADCKLYNTRIRFDLGKSGMVLLRLSVRSVVGVHLTARYWNIAFIVVTTVSSLLLLLFAWWIYKDFVSFRFNYCRHHRISPKGRFWHCLMVYFVNDYLRLIHFWILSLIAVTCVMYYIIHDNTNAVYRNINLISTLEGRLVVQNALWHIRAVHLLLWYVLGTLCTLILLVQFNMLQVLVQVIFVCITFAFTMYMLVFLALFVLAITFLFVILIFAADLYDELSRDENFVLGGLRLLVGQSKIPSHVYESNPVIMLIYPLCKLLELFLGNLLFVYLWSIWPKEDDKEAEALDKTYEMFRSEPIEECEISDGVASLTQVAPDQLDLIPNEIKEYCADEAIKFHEMFRQFNEELTSSGLTKVEYLMQLENRLAKQTHEMLTHCQSLELELEVLSKACNKAEGEDNDELETAISLLEATVADKKNELDAIYAKYKSIMDQEDNEARNNVD
ncbi:putative integral membrane protein [Babesia bovis T2Bo]|uniref:Polycystin cation channel PKD1/PKD2 domain-containing protein n=1 Tax=Babesia bovis TaxID=5865 RepID=A7AP86_BABBO|nr:putative integral membrane protein [Babesia bovis T2Bo]EDO08370.1 putative integral membrane protein [Babesia bovis T2Bo]|eukprot:XP_001611938.1 hypothetical protein [Babesia bovis T2Bo]